jgi:hypothetical protein
LKNKEKYTIAIVLILYFFQGSSHGHLQHCFCDFFNWKNLAGEMAAPPPHRVPQHFTRDLLVCPKNASAYTLNEGLNFNLFGRRRI